MQTRKVDTIFVDIDGTLTTSAPGGSHTPGLSNPLTAVMVARGMSVDEASERVRHAEHEAAHDMAGRRWPFGAEEALGIEPQVLADTIINDFRQRYKMHPDAKRFMQGLRQIDGLRVYPATTNPRLYILGKLAAGGLAESTGTDFFDDCFGGEEVILGGKSSPAFYHALMARVQTHPQHCVMVGDEPLPDLDYALEAGIRKIFIVSRNQTEPSQAGPRGGCFVQSLDTALSIIQSEAYNV